MGADHVPLPSKLDAGLRRQFFHQQFAPRLRQRFDPGLVQIGFGVGYRRGQQLGGQRVGIASQRLASALSSIQGSCGRRTSSGLPAAEMRVCDPHLCRRAPAHHAGNPRGGGGRLAGELQADLVDEVFLEIDLGLVYPAALRIQLISRSGSCGSDRYAAPVLPCRSATWRVAARSLSAVCR